MKPFVIANRHNNTRIDGITISEKSVELQANKQSYEALVANRRAIKKAIAMSNATTTVIVSGKEMTVVEAIEEKHFTQTLKDNLRCMKRQYETEKGKANVENANLPAASERYLNSINMNEKNGYSKDDIKTVLDKFVADNTYELVDPNKMGEWLTKMEDEINDFLTNIDFKLSESNATTVIEVEINETV
jgi:hypothetical protein